MRPELPPVTYGKIDCFGSIEKAIEHTRLVLFRPFDISKWFSFGVIIFLSMLGSGGCNGGNFNFNSPGGTGPGGGPGGGPQEAIESMREFWADNMALIIGIAVGGFVIFALVTVLLAWLGSRGRLMLVRSVAINHAGIGENWREAGKISSSLFWFTIIFWVASWGVMLGIAALAVVLFLSASNAGAETLAEFWPLMAWPALLGLVYIAVVLPMALLLNDFVVPVMYRFQVPCLDAWRIVFGMFRGNVLTLTLFYVIRFVVGIVKIIITMIAGCLTCFIGFFPVISQTITSPIHIFDRAFSMFALESMGPDFQMILPADYEVDPFDDSGPRDLTTY